MEVQGSTKRDGYGWQAATPREWESRNPSRNGSADQFLETKRPKALGDRSGPPMLERSWESGGGVVSSFFRELNLSGAENLTSPYREISFVNTCIRAKAEAMLQAPLRLYKGDPLQDRDAEPIEMGHPAQELLRLLERPSEHQTGGQFRKANVTHRCLDGETVWFLMDEEGRALEAGPSGRIPVPATVVPVIGRSVEIKCNSRGLPLSYVYPSKQRTEFPPHSVVRFLDYDPDNPLRGLGPIEALQRELVSEFQAQRHQEGLFANGGDPGGWIISEGKTSAEKRQAAQDKLDDDYGNAANAGRWRLLQGKGVQVVQARLSPKELAYSDMRAMNREYTAAALGVPLTLVGNDSEAKYANYEAAQRAMWVGPLGIVSYLRSEEEVMNSHFLPRLDVRGLEGIVARHDLSVVRVLQTDNSAAIDRASQIAARGHGVSMNSALEALGVEGSAVTGGDSPLFHSTLRTELELPTSGESSGDGPAPQEDEGEDKEALAAAETAAAGAARDEWARGYLERAHAVIEPHTEALADSARRFLRSYELAQIKRLKDYAANGAEALGTAAAAPAETRDFIPAELTEADIIELLLDPEEWGQKLFDAAAVPITDAFATASEAIALEIGSVPIPLDDDAVASLIETQLTQLSRGVAGSYDATLAKKVKGAILDAFETFEGVSVSTLQEAVRETLPELRGTLRKAFADRDARALAIARTETGKASSTARFESMERSEVVTSHEWRTAQDGEVRDSHSGLHGQVRALGEEFLPRLKFPLDPDAPAEEVVNCRCDAVPVIPEPPTE